MKKLLFYILTVGNETGWPATEVSGLGQDNQCHILGELWEFSPHYHHVRSRGCSVSIVTKLRAGRPEFGSRQVQGLFLLITASRPALGPSQHPTRWVSAAPSPELKLPGRESDH